MVNGIHKRPRVVAGRTYKLNPPHAGSAFYVTINDIQDADGNWHPIEIFINSKNSRAHQWIAALTLMLSALMRMPGDIGFILEELEQVADPEGIYHDNKKKYQSIVQHVADVVREHLDWLAQGRPENNDDNPTANTQ